jgi:ubiquinone/menaquinone biosynthesis C-methylase UbiE
MNLANRQLNNWTIDLLEIKPADHVLELGFGSGLGIHKLAAIPTEGAVAGVDFPNLWSGRHKSGTLRQFLQVGLI